MRSFKLLWVIRTITGPGKWKIRTEVMSKGEIMAEITRARGNHVISRVKTRGVEREGGGEREKERTFTMTEYSLSGILQTTARY